MSGPKKKIFNFTKPRWKRIWDSIDDSIKGFAIVGSLIVLGNHKLIREGMNNFDLVLKKAFWVENTIKNPQTKGLEYLDEEAPPSALPQRTALDQFRAEFAKIRESVENPYGR